MLLGMIAALGGNLGQLVREFADDPGVRLMAALILLDFLFGVSAAVKGRTFKLSWFDAFLRQDILGRAVPYFGVWVAVRLSGDVQLGGFGIVEEGVLAAMAAALGGSILNSAKELGIAGLRSLPDSVAGDSSRPPNPTPPPP